jgi:GntR family transcriptional regulator
MLLRIDFESEVPIYIQIKNAIVQGIARKELSPGDGLPSVRQLAEDIGVNMHTVNKAYGLLKAHEFITMDRRKGAIINGIENKASTEYIEELRKEIMDTAAEAFCKGMNENEFLNVCKDVFRIYSKGE